MKNVKISKRLLTLLLAGTVSVTTIACSVRKDNKAVMASPNISIAEEVQEPIDTGVVTVTENVMDMPMETVLVNQEATVVSEPISEIMKYYQEFSLSDVHAKAAVLGSANVRKGPDVGYDLVTTLNRGTIVEVVGKSDNDWYLLYNNGEYYFTIGSNITMLNYLYDGMTLNDIVPNLTLAIQPTTGLNVRAEGKKDSKKVGYITGSRTYKVLDHLSNNWYMIDYQGQIAYVCGDYCKEVYMLDGNFYQFVYAKQDCYLYDEYGNVKRSLSKYEGGTVYNENDEYYLVWLGDEYGYMRRSDSKIVHGKLVNIDLSLQQLEIIDGSNLLFTTDVVTGKDSSPSDQGYFQINGIRHDTYLTGPNYSVHVDHFAPYNGGEGLHDAKWQNGHFGDVSYYHSGGSHGCINMPPENTQEVFDNIDRETHVLVHK